jgi:hypothetical protein
MYCFPAVRQDQAIICGNFYIEICNFCLTGVDLRDIGQPTAQGISGSDWYANCKHSIEDRANPNGFADWQRQLLLCPITLPA